MRRLFPIAYFPSISYLATLPEEGEVLLEVKETFPKQTFRNRCFIMTAEGRRLLTVPVVRQNHSRTEQVAIDYGGRWADVHLRTIVSAYNAAPYFLYYRDAVEALLGRHYDSIADLCMATTRWLLEATKSRCRLGFTSDWLPKDNGGGDFRDAFAPKTGSRNCELRPYYQVFSDRMPFDADLSAMDLLFNLGPEAVGYVGRLRRELTLSRALPTVR